jgi:ribosome-associated protein
MITLMDTITLNVALKLSGLASTGGQAKVLIQSGQVKVNGEIETRRKKQLSAGDVIEVNGEEFVIDLEIED